MTEIERLIDMLSCGNSMPQERIRWANSIVDLVRAEGAGQIKAAAAENWAAIHKEFPCLPHWTEVERLRGAMFAGHTATINVDALCAAVAAEERERIRKGSKYLDCSDENDAFSYALSFWHVPTSVLALKER